EIRVGRHWSQENFSLRFRPLHRFLRNLETRSTPTRWTSSTQRRRMITSSPCVGACGRSVFRRRPSRTAAWLSESFSIPPKKERSTYRLICTRRSKRESSHFFAKRESHRTKLRLPVSSLNEMQPKRY